MNIQPGTEHEVVGSLEVLERTPGWRVLQEHWRREEENLILKIEQEEDPNKLLRLAGALRQHRTNRTVIARTIEAQKRKEKNK